MGSEALTFEGLAAAIEATHSALAIRAGRAVNSALTLRNWLIGAYLREYELDGRDRATYGDRLHDRLAERLRAGALRRVDARELRRLGQFYAAYPEIWETSAESVTSSADRGLVAALTRRLGAPGDARGIRETASPESVSPEPATPDPTAAGPAWVARLVGQLSFSHFVELLGVADPLARRFYEAEALRGNWSVRELRRQIGALYFERTALSRDGAALVAQVRAQVAGHGVQRPADVVRDPYVFEFLGLDARQVMSESALEDALLDRLQQFLLELGYGFCFEARQKRLVIGETHCFVDLVFYHRVLKCHVLVELKTGAFTHEHLGQLNTYVSYYKATQMTDGDQPPVGILLCTGKDAALVEYALAGMSNALFVSRYQVGLPEREAMVEFVQRAVEETTRD